MCVNALARALQSGPVFAHVKEPLPQRGAASTRVATGARSGTHVRAPAAGAAALALRKAEPPSYPAWVSRAGRLGGGEGRHDSCAPGAAGGRSAARSRGH